MTRGRTLRGFKHYSYGMIYYRLGDTRKAIRHFRKAKKLGVYPASYQLAQMKEEGLPVGKRMFRNPESYWNIVLGAYSSKGEPDAERYFAKYIITSIRSGKGIRKRVYARYMIYAALRDLTVDNAFMKVARPLQKEVLEEVRALEREIGILFRTEEAEAFTDLVVLYFENVFRQDSPEDWCTFQEFRKVFNSPEIRKLVDDILAGRHPETKTGKQEEKNGTREEPM